ncbi:MAG: FAD-dependent oxidoreductase [Candidatus Omnitrophica bacterium]|nr:FAD-dependent oxidoreductase [Candidatus Omnitrophota bacterium]
MNSAIDLIVMGGGIAGVSAAMYAKRAGLKAVIFEPGVIGGQLLFMENVDNFPGVAMGTKGRDFALRLEQTLRDFEIKVNREAIREIRLQKNGVEVVGNDSAYAASGLIVATGASFKKLGLNNEERLLGRGVSYCAICDGFFFKNKDVAVVGGGNSAVEEALYLANLCRKVTLIHRKSSLRALDYLQEEIRTLPNVEIIFNSTIKEIKGGDFLEQIVIENVTEGRTQTLRCNGMFIAIGVSPNTELLKNIVSADENGFITTNEEMKTSCDYIWSCGDCRKRPLRQLITAASEGAIAAVSAYKHIKGHYISS